MIPAINQSAQAMQNSSGKLNQTSHKVANSKGDLPSNMISMIQSEKAHESHSKTIQTADEMLGTVLDLKA